MVLPRSRSPKKEKTDAVLRPPIEATQDFDVTAASATVLKIFREATDSDLVVEDARLDALSLDSLSIIELMPTVWSQKLISISGTHFHHRAGQHVCD